MPKNDIQSLSPFSLSALCHRVLSALRVTPNPFGIPESEKADLIVAVGDLDDKNASVEQTEAAYRAAIQRRDAARSAAATALAQVARTAFANPANTPALIAELGFKPRSTSRTRIVPVTPTKLIAMPQSNGDCRLQWDKLSNGVGVIYRIEGATRIEGGAASGWVSLGETTAQRATLTGYAPGVAASFRIVATKNGIVAPPSEPVGIYAASAAPALRLAA